METKKDEKVGPLVYAQQREDEYRKQQLEKADEIIGDLLSRTEMRSEKFPVLYDISIKIGGLLWQNAKNVAGGN